MEIRNVAIIAHVDHGKTTLVDAMLKQTHTFRENQKEMRETLLLDSHDLEKEKGITILAKNTSVFYKQTKINIIDTPGHADFGGEVERVLHMADAALLLVDASEGPLPQTTFVVKKALVAKLKIIVIINKIDKTNARPNAVLSEVEDLFLDLADRPDQLDFRVLYAVGRDGKVFLRFPPGYSSETPGDLTPLFDTILSDVPNSAVGAREPFQMLISTLDSDPYVGTICIGRVSRGTLRTGDRVALVEDQVVRGVYTSQKLFTSEGLERKEVGEISAGDIAGVSGISQLTIGQTVTDPSSPVSLAKITVEDPTIKITIGPNTSPFSGREGTYCSSAQIKARLLQEKERNLGMHISEDSMSSRFVVSGRGELHLAILIESMRREGYELSVSKPRVVYKTIDGVLCEPYEEITVDVDRAYAGFITEEISKRKGVMRDMTPLGEHGTRFVYRISSQNLLGIRNSLLTNTRGTAVLHSCLLGYFPAGVGIPSLRKGALIAYESGIALSYGLETAQNRGTLFIGPGTPVYEGMVVGISSRDEDIEINVSKGKKKTNVRSETADIAIRLTPPIVLTLETALDLLGEDELLEVTPTRLSLRKSTLSSVQRKVEERKRLNRFN